MLKTFVFTLLVLIPSALASPLLNEVMPNPLNESNEWVEVFAPELINISEWFIGDQNSNDTLICADCMVSGYFLIIGNSASIEQINATARYFATDDSKIGNGLSNTADCVKFFTDSHSSSFCWSSTTEENSFALLSNGSWANCENATPGSQNACQTIEAPQPEPQQEEQQNEPEPPAAEENILLRANFAGNAVPGQTYENLFKIVISDKEDCSDKDSVKVSFNVSGEGSFYTSSFAREVGCSGYAGTGFWTPESGGSYVICGAITETTAGNEFLDDDSVCWRVNVIGEVHIQKPVAEKKEQLIERAGVPATAAIVEHEEPAAVIADEKPRKDIVASFSSAFSMIAQILYKLGLIIK